jgi:NodT family efflux transporter outer membrane factor (OMF) lipoprotein
MNFPSLIPALLAAGLLSACATPSGAPPASLADAAVPAQWQAPLPHEGRTADLATWWQQFNDPVLSALMSSAQAVSPTLAAARSRIEQSRANRTAAGAALLPRLDAGASAVRGRQDLVSPVASSQSAGLQAAWEIDLFGGARAGRHAAQARFEGAQAGWHEARVAVAAEVAGAYLDLRSCEAQLVQSQVDATSRNESSRLTELSAKAGLQAPAVAALARASAAQANSQLEAQRAQCEFQLKALVALTGIDEPALRVQLAAGHARLPQPAGWALDTVPADVLNQRPDLYAAAREVAAASADVSQARADRLPRVSLNGSIGALRVQTSQGTAEDSIWSVGPLAISLPLFDGGRRAANVDAARARYDEAVLSYRARVRGAVREVEQALVQLQSTEARRENAQIAAEGFETSYRAAESRFKGGLGSLFELEDARRSAVQSQSTLIDLQRERVAAWINLYRALGGGWQGTLDTPDGPRDDVSPTR